MNKVKEIVNEYYQYLGLRKAMELKLKHLNELMFEYVEVEREFGTGDEVEVVEKRTDTVVGVGIVTSAKTSFFPVLFVDAYPLESITSLRYEVMAKRKDGTIGNRHFFGSQHYITSDTRADYYIRLKQ